MTTTRALNIYQVRFNTKAPYPSTRISNHMMFIVADTAEVAEQIINDTQEPIKIISVEYHCLAMELM